MRVKFLVEWLVVVIVLMSAACAFAQGRSLLTEAKPIAEFMYDGKTRLTAKFGEMKRHLDDLKLQALPASKAPATPAASATPAAPAPAAASTQLQALETELKKIRDPNLRKDALKARREADDAAAKEMAAVEAE